MRRISSLWVILTLCLSVVSAADNVREKAVLYPSIDQHGDSLILSGRISVPENAKGIILIPHYTIGSNDEAPSNKMTVDTRPFRDDYVLIVPDLIGYGVTSDRVHPYLDGDLAARNCVDMLFGVRSVLDSMNVTLPQDSIYIVGYSQGGATALWILKLIEEEYADRIHVIQCFSGAGPHDVAVTFDEAIRTNRVGLPAVIPLLVLGTDAAYDLNLHPSHFMTPKMEKRYTKWMADKKVGMMHLFLRMPNHKTSHWLTAQGMDKSDPETKRLYEGLQRSSLVLDSVCPEWIPSSPLYLFHSTNDNVVTPLCSEHLKRCFGDQPNITWDFGKYGNHLKASSVFFPRVLEMMKSRHCAN